LKKIIQSYFNVILVVLISTPASAREDSRPNSIGGDYIFEVVSGFISEEQKTNFELGFDFETFIPGTDHHISLGLSSEIEFSDHERRRYFFGPLLSYYYRHFKIFLSSGMQTDFDEYEKWKSRIGLGYEVVWLKHWLVVPTIAMDHVEGKLYPAYSIGLACEFY